MQVIREVPIKLHKHCINLDKEIIRKIPLKLLDFTVVQKYDHNYD